MPALIIITTALIAAPLIFFFGLWHLAASYAPPPPASLLHNKRIILLIAHPDDESMFFAPTVQALTAPHLQNHVKILCLSTGNADGLGDTRRRELEAAALTLGVRRREDIFVLDDETRFRDGMHEQWSSDQIARVLALYTLTTINTVRKYSSIIDNEKAIFVSDMQQYLKAREAMVHGHKSQMVWFRWGWISLGRYMLVNDLARQSF
ncbi:hypothetical protein DV737_g995, partial [Chaetothyriales sp. CBS 132003]